MNTASLRLATAAALAATLALAGCKKDTPAATDVAVTPAPAPAPTTPAPAPAAPATASITQVQLGSSTGADGRVSFETTNFAPTDKITASVSTNTSDPTASVSGKLLVKWTYQDGQVVNEEEKYFTFIGPGVTNFEISKPDGWPSGEYTVTVALDGNVVETRKFVVR